MHTPVVRAAIAAALITRDSSGVMPSSLDVTFSIPAFTPLLPMPVSMSRMNSATTGSGSETSRSGPWSRMYGGSTAAPYQPVEAMMVTGARAGHFAYEGGVAAQSGNCQIHDGGDSEAVQLAKILDRPVDHGRPVPFDEVDAQLELGIADKDVLVHQGDAELGRWARTQVCLDSDVFGHVSPSRRRTDSVSAPSVRASAGTWPGVRDSFGVIPGTSSGRSRRSSRTSTIISRATN